MTSNTSTSIQPVAAEQAPKAAKPPQSATSPSPTQSSVLGWAAAKVGACLHVMACPAAGTLIITSVFLVLRYKNKTRAKPVIQPVIQPEVRPMRPITRSMTLALMHGGEKAIERFKEFHRVSVEEAKVKAALEAMRKELNKEYINFVDLYAKIGIFELTEKEKEVIKLLKEALEKAKKKAKEQQMDGTHTTHELELLLVEMLIYNGNYKEALDYLPSDDVSSTADARIPLYKAVIFTLIKEPDTAEKHFDEYMNICNRFHGSKFYKDAPMHLQVSKIQEFVDLVNKIQKEIQTVHPPPQQDQETAKPNQKELGANLEPVTETPGETSESTSEGKSKAAIHPNEGQPNQKNAGANPESVPKTRGETPESTSEGKSKAASHPNEGQPKEK